MSSRSRTLLILAVGLLVVLPGCGGSTLQKYETSLYTVLREPSPEHTAEHAEFLEQAVLKAEAEGRKPPPGICIECALYLDRIVRGGEAQEFLDRELRYYPESAVIIAVMVRVLAGEAPLK